MRTPRKVWYEGYRARLYSTVGISVGTRDITVYRQWPVWPPTAGADLFSTPGAVEDFVLVGATGGNYYIGYMGMIFDTSTLPDDIKILGAQLDIVPTQVINNVQQLPLKADYYSGALWTYPQGNEAISTFPHSTLAVGQVAKIPITGFSGINPTGLTYLRLGLHPPGGPPSSYNYVYFATFEHATYQEPRLTVSYYTNKSSQLQITSLSSVAASPMQKRFSDAAIAGTGTVTSLPTLRKQSTAAIAGKGTVVPAATLRKPSAAIMSGGGTFIPTPIGRRNSATSIAGKGSLTADTLLRKMVSVGMQGTAGLVATPLKRLPSNVGMFGGAGMALVPALKKGSVVLMAGRGDVTITGAGEGVLPDIKYSYLSIAGNSGMLADTALLKASRVTIQGEAVWDVDPTILKGSAVDIVGAGTFNIPLTARKLSRVSIMGDSDLSLLPLIVKGAKLSIDGRATVTLSRYVAPSDFEAEIEVDPALVTQLVVSGVLSWSKIKVVPALKATLEVA